MDFKNEGEEERKSSFIDLLPVLCGYMQNTARSLQTRRSDGDKRQPVHMVGVSAITLRSGESRHGAPSVREESQVSGSLISRVYGAAAREPSGTTGGVRGGRKTCGSGCGAQSCQRDGGAEDI